MEFTGKPDKTETQPKIKYLQNLLFAGILMGMLFYSSFYSYLLFHTLSELFSIIISATIFMLVWNRRRQIDNQYLVFIGITSIFIAFIDTIHLMAYKGMPIFIGYDSNLPTQLWIGARYLQSLSLLLALFFNKKKVPVTATVMVFGIVTASLLILVFMRIFPVCYSAEIGLTSFKKISEYIIIVILMSASIGLYRIRQKFDQGFIYLLIFANVSTIFAELAFTTYFNVYGPSNLVGHLLKIIAYIFWYMAIVKAGIARPAEILYRRLHESEEKFRLLYTSIDQGMAFYEIITDSNGKPVDFTILDINDSYTRLFGITGMSIGKRIREVMPEVEEYWIDVFGKVALTGDSSYYENFLKTTGKYYSTYSYCPKKNFFAVLVTDITERRRSDEKIRALLEEKEIILKEVHHRIKNNMNTIASLLALQAETLENASAIIALEDAESRVRSMMVLYEKLFDSVNFNEISVAQYLPSLVDEIVSNFPNAKSVRIEKHIDDFILDANKLQPLAIIINELLTNIMKYAFTGRAGGIITVGATLKENIVTLIIADNGNGMNDSVNVENSTGFGLMLVAGLTKQLEGNIRIECENGTRIVLEFKK